MIRDMARDFAARELAPHAGDWDRNGGYPDDILARMGTLGLMGMLVPPAFDGSGADHVSYALAMEEIAAGDGRHLDRDERQQLAGLRRPAGGRLTRPEGTLPQAAGARQHARLLLPHRAPGGLGRLGAPHPRGAGRQCLPAQRPPSNSSRAAPRPTSRWSSRRPTRKPARKGSAAFSCRPTPKATGSRATRPRWASAPMTPVRCLRGPANHPRPHAGRARQGYATRARQSRRRPDRGRGQATGAMRAAYETALAYAKERPELRQADHRPSGGRLPARRHGNGDRGGAALDPSCGTAPRRRRALPQGSLDGEALRLRDRRAGLFPGNPDPGRLRLFERLSGRAHLSRPARLHDL